MSIKRLTASGLCICIAVLLPVIGWGQEVRVTATPDVIEDFRQFVGTRDLHTIDYYGGKGARRDVIELVLLHQALKLGGFDTPVSIVPEQNYRRTLHQVAAGELISSGALVWRSDTLALTDELLISDAVVKDGEFIVGLYTAHDNAKALATPPRELHQLKVVSNPNWKSDIQTLELLGFDHLYLTNTWVSMVRMLAAHRADVTLAPFQPGTNMFVDQPEGLLVPIPGVKVALSGSRHWVISRRHPQGQDFHRALQSGLKQMRKDDRINQAYRESGFYHPQVTHWQLLKPNQP